MTIFFCYESNSGGETVATEAIERELSKFPHTTVLSHSLSPLLHTDFLRFFLWVFDSIIQWMNIICQNSKADWIYTTTYTAGVAAVILKPFFKYHIVWHFHGSRIPPPPHRLLGKTYITQAMKYKVVRNLHTFFVKRMDLIFVPSVQGKQWLLDIIPIPYKSKIRIIPNGVDLGKYHLLSENKRYLLRKKYGFERHAHVLLSIARLEKHKGLETLVQVVMELFHADPNIRLCIVFPHPITESEKTYKKRLGQFIGEHALERIVTLAEEPSHIEDYYHIADCTVSLSQLEFFPLTMLESFACGTPYMGFPLGNTDTFLSHIDKQLVIKDGSIGNISRQINHVLFSTVMQRRMLQKKGCRFAGKFTWSETVRSLLEDITVFEEKNQ